jgi:hypothetical protein
VKISLKQTQKNEKERERNPSSKTKPKVEMTQGKELKKQHIKQY